jgi:hypothetical protein
VADLVAQDDVQDFHRARVAGLAQLRLHGRRGVQAARFQGARHQGHAGGGVTCGALGHRPQAVVGVKVAVGTWPRRGQMAADQREVVGLFRGHAQPVAVEGFGHVGESATAHRAPD